MSGENLNEHRKGGAAFMRRFGLPIVIVAILAAFMGWLYVKQESSLKTAEEAVAAERVKLFQHAEAQHADTVKRSLELMSVPLAWAVRREMLAGNLDQVDQYVGELVRLDGVEEVLVANADGIIVAASDRRHAGAVFQTLYPERYLSADEIAIDEPAAGQWLIAIPVMGLSARLGTMVVGYRPPPFTLGD